MLLDHNTVALCYWTDALSTSKTTNGPIEALLALYKTTDSWVGVPKRTDSYTVNKQYAKYTINYSGHRARLIEAGEITKITENYSFSETNITWGTYYFDSNTADQTITTQGGSKYAWLFDNTYSCTSYGCNYNDNNKYNLYNSKLSSEYSYGYWTATAVPDYNNIVYLVYTFGRLDNFYLYRAGTGIRPVVTVPKSSIK